MHIFQLKLIQSIFHSFVIPVWNVLRKAVFFNRGSCANGIQGFSQIDSSSAPNPTCEAYSAPPDTPVGGEGVAAPVRTPSLLSAFSLEFQASWVTTKQISGLPSSKIDQNCCQGFRFKGKVVKHWHRVCTKLFSGNSWLLLLPTSAFWSLRSSFVLPCEGVGSNDITSQLMFNAFNGFNTELCTYVWHRSNMYNHCNAACVILLYWAVQN